MFTTFFCIYCIHISANDGVGGHLLFGLAEVVAMQATPVDVGEQFSLGLH